jgi:hypothetical protein
VIFFFSISLYTVILYLENWGAGGLGIGRGVELGWDGRWRDGRGRVGKRRG